MTPSTGGTRFVRQPEVGAEYQGLKRWGLFEGLVFGPVTSRRFGRSLGINPLPRRRKICSFDCPYCECGRTEMSMPEMLAEPFPPVEQVARELEDALVALKDAPPETLTLTGNGEPTMHPDFEWIVETVLALKERHAPFARTAALTNGTFIDRETVSAALNRLDTVMLKLDAGREATMESVNAPLVAWTPDRVERAATRLRRVTVQALFLDGAVSNTSEEELAAWIACLERMRPEAVVIYTLDRVPSAPGLRRVSEERMAGIGERLTRAGLKWERI